MASVVDGFRIILIDKIVLINSLARLQVRQPFFRHQNKIAPGWVSGHACVLQATALYESASPNGSLRKENFFRHGSDAF
jgi:hypothetical protein